MLVNALYSLYDALVSIQVPSEKARAVVDAMEHDMTTMLATKSDLAATQLLLKRDFDANHAFVKQHFESFHASFKQDLDLLRSSMTIRMGSMLFTCSGLIVAAIKLL
jgi:hypothetical protein